MLNQNVVPSLQRRGGRAIKKNDAEGHQSWRGRGGQSSKLFGNDHPLCASKVASQHFLDGAATPPVPADHYPQVVRWTRASGTTGGKGGVPSLAKEGTPRHQVNGPVPLEERPGWFVPLPIIGGLNQPPRLRPLRRLRGIFLMGAATPPCPRRGLRLSLQLFSMPPCPAKDVGHGKPVRRGIRSSAPSENVNWGK